MNQPIKQPINQWIN